MSTPTSQSSRLQIEIGTPPGLKAVVTRGLHRTNGGVVIGIDVKPDAQLTPHHKPTRTTRLQLAISAVLFLMVFGLFVLPAVAPSLLDGLSLGPDDTAAAQASADSAADAAKTARQQERFNQAARRVCGENAAWVELGNGAIQCQTKRGKNTFIAEVQL